MDVRLDDFLRVNLWFLLAWVVITVGICCLVRTDRAKHFTGLAGRNITLGVFLVVMSVVPAAVAWTTFFEFKKQEEQQALVHQENIETLERETALKHPERPATQRAPSYWEAQKELRESIYASLEKMIDITVLLLGFLGGALGVNILSDGLLRRDKSSLASAPPRDLYVTKTLRFKGWKVERETVREYRVKAPDTFK